MAIISQYQVVIPGQTITAALWNAMELNIINNGLIPGGIEDLSPTDADYQTRVDPFPGSAISRPTSLEGELHRIRWQLDNIIGKTYWYEDPDVDIATLKTRFDAHTHDGTANNGPQLTSSGLASNSVTTAKITDSNVTTAKIADNAITSAKIAPSAVGSNLTGGGGTSLGISQTFVLTNRPFFNAYNNTLRTNVTGNGIDYTVVYNAEIEDQNGDFNTSTGIFTAPVDGTYFFRYAVSLSDLRASTHLGVFLTLKTTVKDFKTHIQHNTALPLDELTIHDFQAVGLSAGNTAYVVVTVSGGSQDVDVQKGDSSSSNQGTTFMGGLLF